MNSILLNYFLKESQNEMFASYLAKSSKGLSEIPYEYNNISYFYYNLKKYYCSHPDFIKSCKRIPSPFKRYSEIIIPIFYDHFLVKGSNVIPKNDVISFLEAWKSLIEEKKEFANFKSRKVSKIVAKKRIYENIDTIKGLSEYMKFLSKQNAVPVPLIDTINCLTEYYQEFSFEFHNVLLDFIILTKKEKQQQLQLKRIIL